MTRPAYVQCDDPTPAEIRAGCLEAQSHWTPEQERSRRTGGGGPGEANVGERVPQSAMALFLTPDGDDPMPGMSGWRGGYRKSKGTA